MTRYLTSQEAADHLGVRSGIAANKIMGEYGCRNQTVSPTGMATWLAADVARVVVDRYGQALRRHPEGLVTYAREVRRQLRPDPPATVTLTDGRVVLRDHRAALTDSLAQAKISPRERITSVGPDAVWIFGKAALTAAASPKVDGCRHCLAVALTPPGVDLPGPEPEFTELLGPACEQDRKRYEAARARIASAAAARTARTAPARRPQTARRTAGPVPRVYWSSQAQNARRLAADARARGKSGEAARLEGCARDYDARARRGDPVT
ncbi:hypothetical protein [Streptomyces sp. GbtcB6]|uniref:hypothetical protein n=1 Tax=Streptomyces sp. GbtcB6 TaxID=2824751 RepID=UPI001C30754A|nr:hypothetical protein [Streptomyces sp. GbtcB6]